MDEVARTTRDCAEALMDLARKKQLPDVLSNGEFDSLAGRWAAMELAKRQEIAVHERRMATIEADMAEQKSLLGDMMEKHALARINGKSRKSFCAGRWAEVKIRKKANRLERCDEAKIRKWAMTQHPEMVVRRLESDKLTIAEAESISMAIPEALASKVRVATKIHTRDLSNHLKNTGGVAINGKVLGEIPDGCELVPGENYLQTIEPLPALVKQIEESDDE